MSVTEALYKSLVYFTTPKKFVDCACKMVHSGAFPEAHGNVWECHMGKLRHIKP